jgi:hypothetical protein
MLDTTLNYAPAIYPDTHFYPLPESLKVMRGQPVFVAIADVLGYGGALVRVLVNNRGERTDGVTR